MSTRPKRSYLFTGTISREPFPDPPSPRPMGLGARIVVFAATVLAWAAVSGYVGILTYPH